MHNLSMDVLLAHQLRLAFERAGWRESRIRELCEGSPEILRQTLDLLRGDAEIIHVKRVIDLQREVIPDGKRIARVVKHLKMGVKSWESLRIRVMDPYDLQYDRRYDRDSGAKWDNHEEARIDWRQKAPRFLRGQKLPGIHLRNFLLKHPHLIPRCFSDCSSSRPILFWGTILSNPGGTWWVPGIDWSNGEWRKYDRGIDDPERDVWRRELYDNPAAVLV